MKKCTVVGILIVALLLSCLSSCSIKPKNLVNVWNGTVAESFSGGDGSEAKPYEIASCAELAYLAKSTNAGNDYAGKFFSLKCDLDLNNLEWTPIGDGNNVFSGSLDGCGHIIKNLKITGGALYQKEYPRNDGSVLYNEYTSGLFGYCIDASFKNFNIDTANLTIQGITDRRTICAGILCGRFYANKEVRLSNIKISNAQITTDFLLEGMGSSGVSLGGVFGYASLKDSSSGMFERIQADTDISIEQGKASENDIGGFSGGFLSNCRSTLDNIRVDLSVKVDNENCYVQKNRIGAFGSVLATEDGLFIMSNIFSSVEIDKVYDVFHGDPAYTAYALIADPYYYAPDVADHKGFQCKNVFGYVKQVDEVTNETVTSLELFEFSERVIHSETNCKGCETLPENHGFDSNIWNLSDPKNPVLKS